MDQLVKIRFRNIRAANMSAGNRIKAGQVIAFLKHVNLKRGRYYETTAIVYLHDILKDGAIDFGVLKELAAIIREGDEFSDTLVREGPGAFLKPIKLKQPIMTLSSVNTVPQHPELTKIRAKIKFTNQKADYTKYFKHGILICGVDEWDWVIISKQEHKDIGVYATTIEVEMYITKQALRMAAKLDYSLVWFFNTLLDSGAFDKDDPVKRLSLFAKYKDLLNDSAP